MRQGAEFDPLAAAAALREFLSAHDAVWLREEGAVVARLRADDSGFALETEHGKLVCHFWSGEANLVRRVIGLETAPRGEGLRLLCQRLGRPQPTRLTVQPADTVTEASQDRDEFRAGVVAAAGREWPGWRLERPAAGAGALQHFLLRRSTRRMACAALAKADAGFGAEAALAAALGWVEHVGANSPGTPLAGLQLVLPAALCAELAARLVWMRGPLPLVLHTYDPGAGVLTPANEDSGNLESHLNRAPDLLSSYPAIAEQLLEDAQARCPAATLARGGDGAWQLRLHGLTLARQAAGFDAGGAEAVFGVGAERTPLHPGTHPLWQALLAAVAAQRTAQGSAGDALYRLQPEAWMEDGVRQALTSLDPQAELRFIYRQVPACRAGRRDVLDLLGVTRDGRLLVIELKAEEDAAFPLQALDYWVRVRHHLERGDFERMGYFPGVALSRLAPRLLLVAPALRWHPHTPGILRWLSPEVPLQRFGLNEEWRRRLEVVARW